MSLILPVYGSGAENPDVSFVDKRGRLERMGSALITQVTPRQPAEFLVEMRKYNGLYLTVTGSPPFEHLIYLRVHCWPARSLIL